MAFLSTPHRGCNNANYLHTILSAFGFSKDYIKELSANGDFLQSINHEFCYMSKDLELYSFYETVKTSVANVGIYVYAMERLNCRS